MLIPRLDPQERIPFLCAAVASACAASGALIARTAGDALFLEFYDTHSLALMYLGTGAIVGAVAYFFGRFATRFSLNRTLILSCGVLALLALLIRIALLLSWHGVRIFAYFWADLTVYGSVLLFWSFFGQLFDFRQVKKLIGWVGAGGTVACIGAGLVIRPFARHFGTPNLALVVMLLMAVFAVSVFYQSSESALQHGASRLRSFPLANQPGLTYYFRLLRIPQTRLLAMQAMVATIAIVLVDFQFKVVAQAQFPGPKMAAFFGGFYALTNLVILLIQVFALQFVLKGKRLMSSLSVLPASILVGGGLTLMSLSFFAVLATKLLAQTTLFTIDGGAFQILYLGIKKQTRTQVRVLVDGMSKPAAIGITGAVLVLVSGAVKVYWLAVPGVLLAIVWLFLARRNYALYLSGLVEGLNARLLDPAEEPEASHDQAVVEQTRQALLKANADEVPYILHVIQQLDEIDWTPEIRSLLRRPEPEVKIAALQFLSEWGKSGNLSEVVELARHPAAEVRRAAIRTAGLEGEVAMPAIKESLEDFDPGVRAEAATALIDMGHFGGLLQGLTAVKGMLDSEDKSYRMAVASPVSRMRVRGRTECLLQLLDDPEVEVRLAALRACANSPEPEVISKVISQLEDARTAGAAADALIAFGPETAEHLLKYSETQALAQLFRRSIHLPAVLQKIGGPRALEVLKRILESAGTSAPFDVVQAYRRILERLPSFEPYRDNWKRVLSTQLSAAKQRKAWLSFAGSLKKKDFLAEVLGEGYAESLESVLMLLGVRTTECNMEAIYMQLQHGQDEDRSRAREILEHVLGDDWRNDVLELIDTKPSAGNSNTLAEIIREAAMPGASEPLLLGALYAASAGVRQEEMPHLQQLLSHPSGAVRETAFFALSKLEPPEEVTERAQHLVSDREESVRRLAQAVLSRSANGIQEGAYRMITVEKMLFLRHVPLFSVMDSSELGHVALIAREETYPAGSRVIQEGDHGDHMFLIVEGEVLVQRGGVALKKLGPKEFFGEMSIIDGEPRSASVIAQQDCLFLRIDKGDFQILLSTYNSAAVSVVRALNQRLRDALPDLERAQRGM